MRYHAGGCIEASVARQIPPPPGTNYDYQLRTHASGYSVPVTLAVTTPATREAWQHVHFGPAPVIEIAAASADPDGDGFDNLMEYALDTNPLVPGMAAPFTLTGSPPASLPSSIPGRLLGISAHTRFGLSGSPISHSAAIAGMQLVQ